MTRYQWPRDHRRITQDQARKAQRWEQREAYVEHLLAQISCRSADDERRAAQLAGAIWDVAHETKAAPSEPTAAEPVAPEVLRRQIERAEQALSEGDADLATALFDGAFRTALEQGDGELLPRSTVGLVESLIAAGKVRIADQVAHGLLRQGGESPFLLELCGRVRLAQERWADAEAYFLRSHERRTDKPAGLLADIAACNFHLDRIDDAERWARNAVAVDPSSPNAVMVLALVLAHRRQWDEAERMIGLVRTLAPHDERIEQLTAGIQRQRAAARNVQTS